MATPATPHALLRHDRWTDADEMRWTVRAWAARMNVNVNVVHLRAMRRKWASMSTRGRLTLDTGLLTLPKPLGEYVIVHELAHLLAPNHGRVFKSFMEAYLPDWRERERLLQGHARPAKTESVADQ